MVVALIQLLQGPAVNSITLFDIVVRRRIMDSEGTEGGGAMKIRMHEALRRLNDWTLIAFNDPHALDGARTVQGWPPLG